jgi:hypothetical protein
MVKIILNFIFFGLISGAFSQKLLVCQVQGDTCVFKQKIVNKDEQVVIVADHA